MQKFYLSDNFLEDYREQKPDWGPLGEFVFYRTYSRLKEDGTNEQWWETVKRVVEGCFNTQKEHCLRLRLPWRNQKAQRSAQKMYDKIFNFKFLPPGRGLWMMGSKFVEERNTSMPLFNCAFVTTDDIDTRGPLAFVWAMDSLMLGVGCIAEDSKIMTAEGPKNIQDLEGHPFVAIVDGKPYFAKYGSWKTGNKPVFSLKAKEGYELELTEEHRVLTDNGWKELRNIKIGDKIRINNSSKVFKWGENETYSQGYLLGVFWGDGYYSRDPIVCVYDKDIGHEGIMKEALKCAKNVRHRVDMIGWRRREERQIQELSIGTWAKNFIDIDHKHLINDKIEITSYDFHIGFLRGAFDADGSVLNNKEKHDRRISLTQVSYNDLQIIQRMLLRFGIKSKISKKRDPSDNIFINKKKTKQKECYTLIVSSGENIKRFYEYINFSHSLKKKKLEEMVKENNDFYKKDFFVEVESIEKVGNKNVYDINVDEVSSFDANGFYVHNCGFDTRGSGKITIKQPKNGDGKLEYQIPDTREGWTESLELLLDAFFSGKKMPNFDYSLIRKAGEPIKGFGGVASGPGPLRDMHNNIAKLLEKRIGEEIRSVDIVDVFDFIGACVVAGNVRRSALIALGNADDKEYITMKDYNLHGKELMSHRWASNNSVFANTGKTNYSKFTKSIALNGEPGICWIDNLRKFGRTGEIKKEDTDILGLNPCYTGNTLIATADGRGAVPIKQLAEEKVDVPLYSVNTEGKIEIKWGRNPRLTGRNKELIKVILDDDSEIVVTPEHEFRLIDGTAVKAKNLKSGNSLTRFSKYREKIKKDGKDYLRVCTDTINKKKDKIFEHRLIAKFNDENKWNEMYKNNQKNGWIDGGIVVHHKDYNSLNNSPDNLEIMTFKEHVKFHSGRDCSGENNGMFGKKHSDETKKEISFRVKERCKDSEYIKKISEAHKKIVTDEDRDRMRKVSKDEHIKFYKEFEKRTDLETLWIDDTLFVKKNCETCGKGMILPVRRREQSFCSRACVNKAEYHIKKRRNGQKVYFEDSQRRILHKQIMAFKDLSAKFERNPLKKEWENECKKKQISHRFQKNSQNSFVMKDYEQLKEIASDYNHRVKKIEKLDHTEDVYNITVDDNHTLFVVTNFDELACDGVATFQCGEITLQTLELCNLVETFPSRHENYEEYQETLKYAYLYAKTVTLIPSHWEETNAVMMKNRRIGVSQTGIVDAFVKHGRRAILDWSNKGYEYLRNLDNTYSNWLCVPRSNKITTVKPSGSVSLLPGVSPGIHYHHAEYYIRRVRIATDSPLVKVLRDAGYHIEESVYGTEETKKGTVVISFPVHEGLFRKKKEDVTCWEQVKNAADYQKYWADNNVSITVTFNKEEANDIPIMLEAYEDQLKSISFLPLSDHGYEQAPYEEITKEQYEKMVSKIKEVDYEEVTTKPVGERYCDGDNCEFDPVKAMEEKKNATTTN